MNRRFLCAALAAAAFSALPWSAASADETDRIVRFQRQLDTFLGETQFKQPELLPADQRWTLEYGLFLSAGFGWIDDIVGDPHRFGQYEATAFALASYEATHTFYARGSVRFRDFATGEGFEDDGDGDGWIGPRMDRFTYSFNYANHVLARTGKAPDYNIEAVLGRQLVSWGSGTALATELDGLQLTGTWNRLSLDVLLARTRPEAGDFDTSRPDFDSDTIRTFYGAKLSFRMAPQHMLYAFVLRQEDGNDDSIAEVSGVTTEFGYDSNYFGAGVTGNITDELIYGAELIIQTGSTYSSPVDAAGATVTQTRDDIRAFAANLRLDWVPDSVYRPRVGGELIIASGDRDRQVSNTTFGGNAPGTTDNGFNAMGLLNTGYAFNVAPSNLVALRAGGSIYPMPHHPHLRRLQTGVDVLGFFKLDSDAPMSEPTSEDTVLGMEIDLFLNWQITSDVQLLLRYGVFFPGAAIIEDDIRHFFYAQVTYGV